MKKHELSKLFPPMSERELKELAADIKVNGLHSPIITHEGAILDGAQRERACKIARVPPHYLEFHDLSPQLWRNGPLAYVVSENLRRRHLSVENCRELHKKLVPMVEQHLKQEAERIAVASATAKRQRGGVAGKPGFKKKAVQQVAVMTGTDSATVYRNISNGTHPVVKKAPPSLKLDDNVEKLIELARLNEGSLRARFDDYIISVRYSPEDKLLPAVKTLSVEACGITSQ